MNTISLKPSFCHKLLARETLPKRTLHMLIFQRLDAPKSHWEYFHRNMRVLKYMWKQVRAVHFPSDLKQQFSTLLITLPSMAHWFPTFLSSPQRAWKDQAWGKGENVFKGNLENIQKSLEGGLNWEALQGSQRPPGQKRGGWPALSWKLGEGGKTAHGGWR